MPLELYFPCILFISLIPLDICGLVWKPVLWEQGAGESTFWVQELTDQGGSEVLAENCLSQAIPSLQASWDFVAVGGKRGRG